jgi:hypothetical protein
MPLRSETEALAAVVAKLHRFAQTSVLSTDMLDLAREIEAIRERLAQKSIEAGGATPPGSSSKPDRS